MPLFFGDFKCAMVDYEGTPDVAGLSQTGQLVFMGDLDQKSL
jgi:hypothetical protein